MTEQPVQQAAAQPAQPEGDLSKRTLVMLVALSCFISLIGTVAMIYQLSTADAAPVIVKGTNTASAEVGFVIGTQEPQTSAATGFATFGIGE